MWEAARWPAGSPSVRPNTGDRVTTDPPPLPPSRQSEGEEAVGTARATTKTSHKPVDPPPFDSRCPCILETKQVLCSALFIISHYLSVGRRPSACAFFACRPRLYKGIDAREYNARAPYVITALIRTITAAHSLHSCGVVGGELFKPLPIWMCILFLFFLYFLTSPTPSHGESLLFDSNSAASIASKSVGLVHLLS